MSHSLRNNTCRYRFLQRNSRFIDVYWINTDQSKDRRISMHEMFHTYGLRNTRRISAVTKPKIHIPSSLNVTGGCIAISDIEKQQEIQRMQSIRNERRHNNQTVMLSSICGSLTERADFSVLGCTLSHMVVMYHAIHDETSQEKEYALILEDDIQLIYEIDFKSLIATAPKDFAILQLVTSNKNVLNATWSHFLINPSEHFWVPRRQYEDAWCTAAYIIHKQRLIDEITKYIEMISYRFYVARISRLTDICFFDSICCSLNITHPEANCTKLFQYFAMADYFLYNLLPNATYLSTIPLFDRSQLAKISTIHQEHVNITHDPAFDLMRTFTGILLSNQELIPPFINTDCPGMEFYPPPPTRSPTIAPSKPRKPSIFGW